MAHSLADSIAWLEVGMGDGTVVHEKKRKESMTQAKMVACIKGRMLN